MKVRQSVIAILVLSEISYCQMKSMGPSRASLMILNEIGMRKAIAQNDPEKPPQKIIDLLDYQEKYKRYSSEINGSDRERCIPNPENKKRVESYKAQIERFGNLSEEDQERMVDLYKAQISPCDSIIIGFKDVDSALLRPYFSAYLKTRKAPESDSLIANEFFRNPSIDMNSALVDSISVNREGRVFKNIGGLKVGVYGYILTKIYGDLSKVSSCMNNKKYCTDQNIENNYFKTQRFTADAESALVSIEDYLLSKATKTRKENAILAEAIRSNRQSLNGQVDSIISRLLKRYPIFNRNEISEMFTDAIEYSARQPSPGEANASIRSSWSWNVVEYLVNTKRPNSIANALLENRAEIGMTFDDVYAIHGKYLDNAEKNFKGNGLEIFICYDLEGDRIYKFRKNRLEAFTQGQ